VPALEAACEGVVRRHEVLRTTFELRSDGPEQVVAPPTRRRLPGVALQRLDTARRAGEMYRWSQLETNRAFDLARGPLLRTLLFQLARGEHALLVVMHHIVSDAWSMTILWREAMDLYRFAVEGRPAALEALPL